MSDDPDLMGALRRKMEHSMTRRPDEVELWNAFGLDAEYHWPREAAAALGIPRGRAEYLCEKWARQGILDYGVSALLGWKTGRNAPGLTHEPTEWEPTTMEGDDNG